MLTKLIVIISQYIHMSNYYAVPLKLIKCYMSIISQLKKKPNKLHCLLYSLSFRSSSTDLIWKKNYRKDEKGIRPSGLFALIMKVTE